MATPTNLPASFNTGAVLTAAQMNDVRGSFRILRVVATQKNDTTSTSSSTMVDITGLSASITPQSTSNKVLIIATYNIGFDSTPPDDTYFTLVRGSTQINLGTGGSVNSTNYQRGNSYSNINLQIAPMSTIFLDSPSTTSATTYKMQWSTRVGTIYLNRRGNAADVITSSNIVLMEVSA